MNASYQQLYLILPIKHSDMELIIKPTEMCNFRCTFCSSANISADHSSILDHNLIFQFLTKYPNTNTIIINGGDPLMVSPDYYWKIIQYLDDKNMDTTLSFTTNLWAFYKNPTRWTSLFKNERVGITTSFNYGENRRITNNRVYTEDDFWRTSNLMADVIGYRPGFISVITTENEQYAIDHVYLAKQMDVECKLNYAMASGNQQQPYFKDIRNIYKNI